MHPTDTDLSPAARPGRSFREPAASFAALALVLALGLVLAARAIGGDWAILPALGFAAAATLAGLALCRHWTAPRLGPANGVTLLRLAGAALLLLPMARPELAAGGTGWAIFALALLTLALDGVDGLLARRTGLAGPWGARFDMEVDAVFALLLSLVAWQTGAAGPWVLMLGGMRYVFVLAALRWRWLGAPLPERFRRKAVCVIQIATLCGLLAPVAAPPLSVAAALLALGALAWSFAADILWLAEAR